MAKDDASRCPVLMPPRKLSVRVHAIKFLHSNSQMLPRARMPEARSARRTSPAAEAGRQLLGQRLHGPLPDRNRRLRMVRLKAGLQSCIPPDAGLKACWPCWHSPTWSPSEHRAPSSNALPKFPVPARPVCHITRLVACSPNRPASELTPGNWTHLKGSHGEVQNKVQAQGRRALSG